MKLASRDELLERSRAGYAPGLVAKSEYTTLELAGHEVRLSNPAKVYFPTPGWTKLDIATYYVTVAEAALIHLRERPTVMKRFVNGIMEEPIWQKRVPQNMPEWLQTATVAFPSGRTAEELVANDAAHLVWAVNLGVIDFNPWPARRADLDHPDELRVDLDPTPGVGWDDVRRTAMVVRDVLEEHGLRGYPKTSGSKGIHVNVRIEPRVEPTSACAAPRSRSRARWSAARPDLATSKWWKEERHGVFVDYNQNARDRTVASCYSVRPTPDARVSCALHWDEVPDVEPGDLRLDTVPERLRTVGDPAADIDEQPGSLDGLLELARRDEEEGLGDAPWPPHFPKQKGEPKRVQPSRDADRPTHRGRAGDPQPGGPPPGVNLGQLPARVRLQAPDRPGLRARVRRLAPLLRGVRRRLPELVDLDRVAVAELPRDRPHLDGLVALVAVRAPRPGATRTAEPARDLVHVVAEAHRQRAGGDEVELLELLVVVAGALLEVASAAARGSA